jgi:hypothetical protein
MSHHVLALVMDCEEAGGRGVDPTNPPIVWEAWQGGAARWVECATDYDTTGVQHERRVHAAHAAAHQGGVPGPAGVPVRCRNVDKGEENKYEESPEITRLRIESRASLPARHAQTVLHRTRRYGTPTGVRLGTRRSWSGSQARHAGGENIDGTIERWVEVMISRRRPRTTRTSARRSDGSICSAPPCCSRRGTCTGSAHPGQGQPAVLRRYQHGGGRWATCRGMLQVLKSSIRTCRA